MAIEKGGFLAVYDQNMRLTSKKSMRSLNIENSFGVFQQAAKAVVQFGLMGSPQIPLRIIAATAGPCPRQLRFSAAALPIDRRRRPTNSVAG
jgi:hypothetical protein